MVGRRGREGEEESQRGAATKAADSSSSRLCTHAAGEGKWAPWVNVLDGQFLWAFMASHKPGPTFISLSLLVLELNTVVKPRITKVNAYMYTLQRRI